MNLRRLMQNCPSKTKPTRGQSCASQQKFAADGRDGSNAPVELSWHVGFTPDSGRACEATNRRFGPCVDGSELARTFFTSAALVGAAMCSASHDGISVKS